MKKLKKLLSLLPALLVTLGFVCIPALADEVTAGPGPDGGAVEITGETLLAMADVENVISLNGNYTLTETVFVEDRTLTIRGTEGTRITVENTGMMLCLINSTLKLENITLDVQGGIALYLDQSVCEFDGTIWGGTSDQTVQAVYVGQGSRFTMNGGEISSIGYEAEIMEGLPSAVILKNGLVSDISVEGAACDSSGYIMIERNAPQVIHLPFADLTPDTTCGGLSLGNACPEAANRLTELAKDTACSTCGGNALWFRPETETVRFTCRKTTNNFLKAAYIPLDEDGTPADQAELTAVELANTDPINVELTGLAPGQPYALMLVQPDHELLGRIQLSGPKLAEEELDRESYQVNYTFTYQPESLYSFIPEHTAFTAAVTLDPALTYVEGSANLTCGYCGLDGVPVYDPETHTVTFPFLTTKQFDVDTSVTITFSAAFASSVFEQAEALTASAKLTGGNGVELETLIPCSTRLEPIPRCTVTFDRADGSEVAVQIVKSGHKAVKPEDPIRDGFTFNGWSLENVMWDFEEDEVYTDLTLIAQWTENPIDLEPDPPVETDPPIEPDPPAETDPPIEPDPPAETDPPIEPDPPAETDPPSEPDLPTETDPPVESDPPSEPDPPVKPDPPGQPVSPGRPDTSRKDSEVTVIQEETPLLAEPVVPDHTAYIFGYEDGTVRPENNISREEAAMIFYRLMPEEVRAGCLTDENSFTDVGPERWSNTAISTLVRAGILNGYADGTFRPGQHITRAEFAVICNRFDPADNTIEKDYPFTDIEGHWAKDLIVRAYHQGWVSGCEGELFAPDQPVKRGEAIQWINQALGRGADGDSPADMVVNAPSDVAPDDRYYYPVIEATGGLAREVEETVEAWTDPAGSGARQNGRALCPDRSCRIRRALRTAAVYPILLLVSREAG